MPETTPEFHHLAIALATARELLKDLPEHDIRNDLDELKLKSYVLLQHAAVEEYLERASIYALNECMKAFEEHSLLTEPLVAVCAYYDLNEPSEFGCSTRRVTIEDVFRRVCRKAIATHRTALEGVHGIKTKDQEAILHPVGIDLHQFDHVLSQKLNSLGRSRGGLAHRFRIRQLQPRSALESDTSTLLRLLLLFDNEVCRRMALTYRS